MKDKKVCLITGGSSGIGLAAANALKNAGVTVYELSRREHHNPGVTHIKGDVTDEESLASAVDTITAREGRLDILICCAGFGISGAVEFTEKAAAEKQFAVNFFGAVNAAKAALPVMRRQRSGRVILVSSVAGEIAIPFQTYYSAAKAALNSYAQGLLNEVRPYGISVTAVMPGDIKTGFTAAREKSPAGDSEYSGRISRSVATMEKDELGGMSPDVIGHFLCRAALKKRVPPLCTVGLSYKLFVILNRLLPRNIVMKLVYIIYAK